MVIKVHKYLINPLGYNGPLAIKDWVNDLVSSGRIPQYMIDRYTGKK